MDEAPQELLFRANKRRKVFRKRAVGDEQDQQRQESTAAEDAEDAAFPVVRRPAPKKQGVIFSTMGNQAPPSDTVSSETALVPFSNDDDQLDEDAQNDRFIKPTGKADVVEDKHLTAYVDSKLAELRSKTATPTQNASGPAASDFIPAPSTFSSQQIKDERSLTGPANSGADAPGKQRGYPYGSRNRGTKPRRQPHARDEDSLARDAMVERILQESEIPLYDRASSSVRPSSKGGLDADEAAAEAFKAEFLASLEEQNRRKPPAPPANSRDAKARDAKAAPSGPKLGGSRAQREKMRALEEAKNAAKK